MRALVLLLMLMPMGQAGTASDPEILDVRGDVRSSAGYVAPPDGFGAPEPLGAPPEALDVVASWFHDETHETLAVTMQVADLAGLDAWDDPQMGFIRWGTRFELTNYNATSQDYWERTWIIGVGVNNGPPGWSAEVQPPSRNGELQPRLPADFEVDQAAGTITVVVDREHLGGPMAGDRMTQTMSLHDGWRRPQGAPLAGIDYSDQAPDGNDPSRDYVFTLDTGQTPAPVVVEPPSSKEAPLPLGVMRSRWQSRCGGADAV